MFKNHYDTDITTWSPAGRLYQIEYATEAVKQGAPTVGVKSETHVVIAALKRSPTAELSSYQEKVFKLASHCGMSICGLVNDARVLGRFIRELCMNHEYICGSKLPIARIADELTLKHQRHTQSAAKRPFGVGLLIAGYDDNNGPQLIQASPSGDMYVFKATAIGSRSQSARTYLEKNFELFADCPLSELVIHALMALSSTASEGVQLNTQNCTIAIVGNDIPFTIYADEDARQYLNELRQRPTETYRTNAEESRQPDEGDLEVPMVIEDGDAEGAEPQ